MAERQRAVLVLLGGLFVRQGERFGNLHHEHHDEGQREDAHGDEQGGCGVADRGLCGVPHEITYQHRNDRGGQRVERTAELHELVAAVAAAAQRIEHGVDHRIEHTHRETRNEGADQIDAETGHQTRKIRDADADEAYGHGSERRLLVADALEHQARRQTHEGVGDEIGRVAELRHEVRRAELVLDDDSHRVLEPRHEGDHRKEREHHRNGQNVVFFLCFHKVFQIGFLRYRLRSAT